MNTSNRSPAVNEAKNEAPEIYSGKVGVEIVPDMQSRQTGNCDSPTPDMSSTQLRQLNAKIKKEIEYTRNLYEWLIQFQRALEAGGESSRPAQGDEGPRKPAGELCPSSDTARKPTPDSPSEHQST